MQFSLERILHASRSSEADLISALNVLTFAVITKKKIPKVLLTPQFLQILKDLLENNANQNVSGSVLVFLANVIESPFAAKAVVFEPDFIEALLRYGSFDPQRLHSCFVELAKYESQELLRVNGIWTYIFECTKAIVSRNQVNRR